MDNLRLRSNTFVTLLLRAGRPELSSKPEWGESNEGITRSGLLADLLRLSMPAYMPKRMETLVSYFSRYIQGCPPNSPQYLPFFSPACRNGLAERLQTEYESVIKEMDMICQTYLDLTDYKNRILVAGIVDTILADDTFTGCFDTGHGMVDKKELEGESNYTLQPFLVSVWSTILFSYPDTRDGAKTYEAWTSDAGYNTPRAIVTEIGATRAKKIAVSVDLPEDDQAEMAEKEPGNIEEETASTDPKKDTDICQDEGNTQQTLGNSNGRIYNQSADKNVYIEHADNVYLSGDQKENAPAVTSIPDGLHRYLSKLANKYNCIPTILYKEALTPFRDYYVPNDVKWYELNPKNRHSYDIRQVSGASILKLMDISRYIVLSGTGGLGKSMMMRNLLLNSIDGFFEIGMIPFFIPLKDYELTFASMLDYVFSISNNLWPELTPESLDFILTQGKALLLFDGLDEIHTSKLSVFTKLMNGFQDRYSDNAFIISSRPYSNFQSFTRSTVLYLQPFTVNQALELVDRYNYRSDAPSLQSRFRYQLEHDLYHTHKGFSDNPLLLSIMMLTFEMDAEVPMVKYLFYQEAYTVLSRRHDALKDGYSRKLSTGWNANQFADYFAFFCATTYNDGQISFTLTQIEQYFKLLVKKYSIEDVTVDDFIYDLINNLCLLYQDGLNYGFIHRSFQEYFCAKYFNAQLDELLVHVIPVFDRDDTTKKGDSAIEMLYDMKPKAVEKYLILPYLRSLIEECENTDGIWSFLSRLYEGYEMADGDAWPDEDSCKPHSNLYAFILERFEIPLLSPKPEEFPNIDFFTQNTLVYREDLQQDEWKDDLPSDYEYYYGEPEVLGYVYAINWKEVKDQYKSHPSLLEGFIPAVEDENGSFMSEYNAIKELISTLEERSMSKPKAGNLFDLME